MIFRRRQRRGKLRNQLSFNEKTKDVLKIFWSSVLLKDFEQQVFCTSLLSEVSVWWNKDYFWSENTPILIVAVPRLTQITTILNPISKHAQQVIHPSIVFICFFYRSRRSIGVRSIFNVCEYVFGGVCVSVGRARLTLHYTLGNNLQGPHHHDPRITIIRQNAE